MKCFCLELLQNRGYIILVSFVLMNGICSRVTNRITYTLFENIIINTILVYQIVVGSDFIIVT